MANNYPETRRPVLQSCALVGPLLALAVVVVLIAMTQAPPLRPDRKVLEWIFNGLLATNVLGVMLGIVGLFGIQVNGIGATLCSVFGILLNLIVGLAVFIFAGLALMQP